MNDKPEILDMEPLGAVAERVVQKAGQSLAARQEQNNLPAPATPMELLDRALARGADPSTLEKLLELQERWEANQARKAFDAAVAAAKAEIPVIKKNRHVGFKHRDGGGETDYWHEDLAEIARTVDPILSEYGLSYRFRSQQADGRVSVTCILTHRDGYSEETTLSAAPDASGKKNSIQQVGSAITYLQRYTLKLALGLAAAQDDDGRASGMDTDDLTPISDEQAAKVRELIDATGTDIARFCRYMGVESIPEITQAQYQRAIAMLEKKRRAA